MQNEKVTAISLKENEFIVDKEATIFRPAVYGIIINNKSVIVKDTRALNNKLWFFGGEINLGESKISALKREFLEEIGRNVIVLKELSELNFYFHREDLDTTYQCRSTFYLCSLIPEAPIKSEESPWLLIPINELRPEEFHIQIQPVIAIIKSLAE